MSYRNNPYPYRSDSPDSSPAPSSGAATPTTAGASSTFLSSSVSSLWGGLVRRFSAETTTATTPPYNSRSSPENSFSQHDDKMSYHGNGIDGVYTPPSSHSRRAASPLKPPPLEPLQLNGFSPDTAADARLLTPAIAEEIRTLVPARLSLADEWNLVYSLEQDGASLATLYDKCDVYRGKRVGFVLVVKDCEGGIFGAYLSDLPHPAPKYFGTGECFLWRASTLASLPPPPSEDTTNLTGRTTTVHAPGSPLIRFKAFPYSGVNEYYMLCETHFLSMGAGDGKYGLWLDDALEKGISSTCQTFGNERLSDEGEKFGVLGVEVWVVGA
ncbi:oxidation resistance protein 1 [Podospora aff. communis PSN243]|uniref:Oxidation resistance protein 1 n=1 Tax=Podospora aff. communis PSN243 TaxID=3040156 RepID=A0AAV9GXY4_9PEZI|nr:oxidation resistance protein 1 [Podospora aff. communis PSN243]